MLTKVKLFFLILTQESLTEVLPTTIFFIQAVHLSHFPNCKMVFDTEQRNYPVNEFPDPPADRERDYPCRFPFNPHMRKEVARQDTFDRRWPVGRTAATPAEISQAGFFFLGIFSK